MKVPQPKNLQHMMIRTLLFFFILVFGAACTPATGNEATSEMTHESEMTHNQAIVATRGAEVMPFDLEKTIHVFESLEDGGLQTVKVKDPTDAAQIALIQAHLSQEAERFRQGDFGDPAQIHGDDMPGLAVLQAGVTHITVEYTALSDGGQIRYTADTPELVQALHDWFAAQLTDHGSHATDS